MSWFKWQPHWPLFPLLQQLAPVSLASANSCYGSPLATSCPAAPPLYLYRTNRQQAAHIQQAHTGNSVRGMHAAIPCACSVKPLQCAAAPQWTTPLQSAPRVHCQQARPAALQGCRALPQRQEAAQMRREGSPPALPRLQGDVLRCAASTARPSCTHPVDGAHNWRRCPCWAAQLQLQRCTTPAPPPALIEETVSVPRHPEAMA